MVVTDLEILGRVGFAAGRFIDRRRERWFGEERLRMRRRGGGGGVMEGNGFVGVLATTHERRQGNRV